MPVPSPQSPVSGLQSPVPSPQSPVSSLQSPVSSLLSKYLPLAAFAILWLDLIHLLSSNWEAREQYAYGWFVPFFAAALLWRRWLDRPLPQSPVTSLQSPVSSPWSVVSGLLMIFLAALLLPLRVIFEINTDWPLIAWPYTTIIVLLTLYAFHLAGPKSPVSSLQSPVSTPQSPVSSPSPFPVTSHQSPVSSPWLWHFAFPTAFILVALVWPYRIEHALTQNLMQIVASLTVEILGWLNVPALQRGNLIEISTGVLGVDEACSGIRSFQSTLMAGLLMGELYRLKIWARAALVLIGLGLAFCFNVVRTLVLTWQANKIGMSAVDDWHDPAGYTIAIACFISLWALALLATKVPSLQSPVSSPSSEVPSPQSTVPSPSSEISSLQSPVSSPSSEVSSLQSTVSSPSLPSPKSVVSSQWSVVSKYLLALGIWSLFTIAATETWYRYHEHTRAQFTKWTVNLPETNPTFKKVELGKREVDLLQSDITTAGKWQESDGSNWHVYFFRWEPKNMRSVLRARGHSPELCLPGAGLRQTYRSEIDFLRVQTLSLPFHKYTFDAGGKPLHVFFCLWEDGKEHQRGMRILDQLDRLDWVFSGKRQMGQQTLEIIVSGYSTLEEAELELRKQLPHLIKMNG